MRRWTVAQPHSALALIALSAALGACRFVRTIAPAASRWTPRATVVVVPKPVARSLPAAIQRWTPPDLFASPQADDQVATLVADGIRTERPLDILPISPGDVLVEGDEDEPVCRRARAAGADFVVFASADVSIEHDVDCWVSNGVVRRLFIDIEPTCIVAADNGWNWSKGASAVTVETATCTRTGGALRVALEGNSRTEPADGVDELVPDIRRRAGDLFPYPPPASARRVAGRPLARDGAGWIDIQPYAVASQVKVGDERRFTRGGGGRFQLEYRGVLVGFNGEIVAVHDVAARDRLDTSGLLNFGLEGGLVRPVSRSVDLYALLSAGVSAVFTPPPEDPASESGGGGAAPYAGAVLGARLTLDRIYLSAELGGIATTRYSVDDDHRTVTQRAPLARVAIGFNFWR